MLSLSRIGLLGLALLLSGSFAFQVFAQTGEVPPADNAVDTSKIFVSSEVEFSEAKAELVGDQVVVKAKVTHKAPARSMIYRFGAEFSQMKDEVPTHLIARESFEEIFEPNETKEITLSVPTPQFFDGTTRVYIGAMDDSGRLAGKKEAGQLDMKSVGKGSVTNCVVGDKTLTSAEANVNPGAVGTITCEVKYSGGQRESLTLVAEAFDNRYSVPQRLGETPFTPTSEAKTQTVNVTWPKAPGAWSVRIVLANAKQQVMAPFVRGGVVMQQSAGMIKSLNLASGYRVEGDQTYWPVQMHIEYFQVSEPIATLELTDAEGPCANPITLSFGADERVQSGEFVLRRACDEPTVAATLSSKEQASLDTTSFNLKAPAESPAEAPLPPSSSKSVPSNSHAWLLVVVIVILITCLVLIYRKLRTPTVVKVLVFAFCLTGVFLSTSENASAWIVNGTLNPSPPSSCVNCSIEMTVGGPDAVVAGTQITIEVYYGPDDGALTRSWSPLINLSTGASGAGTGFTGDLEPRTQEGTFWDGGPFYYDVTAPSTDGPYTFCMVGGVGGYTPSFSLPATSPPGINGCRSYTVTPAGPPAPTTASISYVPSTVAPTTPFSAFLGGNNSPTFYRYETVVGASAACPAAPLANVLGSATYGPTTAAAEGLTPGTYKTCVQACNANGCSGVAASAVLTVTAAPPPPPPTVNLHW